MANELTQAEQTAEKVSEGIKNTVTQTHDLLCLAEWFPPNPKEEGALDTWHGYYKRADDCYNELHRAWAHGEDQRLEFTKPLNEVLRKINVIFKSKLDPIAALKMKLKGRMEEGARKELFWKRAEEDRKMREDRKRLEDEQLARAQKAQDQGQEKEADKIIARPIIVPPVAVQGATDEARTTTQVKWTAKVTDKMLFIKAVASGEVDSGYVEIDEQALKNIARTSKGKIKWPGVEVYEDIQIGARR